MSTEMRTFDLRGEVDAYASFLARLAVRLLAVGESLQIITDSPAAVDDLNKAFGEQGDEVRRVKPAAGGWVMTVRRGDSSFPAGGGAVPDGCGSRGGAARPLTLRQPADPRTRR